MQEHDLAARHADGGAAHDRQAGLVASDEAARLQGEIGGHVTPPR
jgi:hypothetical protein